MNLESLAKFNEVAILFSPQFNHVVQSIYEQVTQRFPEMNILLVSSSEIICSAKSDKYESYILVGIECPLHTFSNAIQYKVDFDVQSTINSFDGLSLIDSIYSTGSSSPKSKSTETNILVISENQLVLDFYCSKYENVTSSSKELIMKNRVEYLMKENILSLKFNNKRMIGVIFTSRLFEDIADALVRRINGISRAYKIFLKDVSYERLISIDNLDCIVLVDCPLFQCNLRLHVPVLSPFSVDCAISGQWSDVYDRNVCPDLGPKELVISSFASELMVKREYQGALFTNDENDMTIHEGQKGIASSYENEGK